MLDFILAGRRPSDLVLPRKSSQPIIKIQKHEQPDRDETVREDRQEIVRGIVSLADGLVDMAVGGSNHEKRPAEPRGQPERAANPKTQEAQKTPCPVVKPDLELERASRWPADELCRAIGKEHVGDESKQ